MEERENHALESLLDEDDIEYLGSRVVVPYVQKDYSINTNKLLEYQNFAHKHDNIFTRATSKTKIHFGVNNFFQLFSQFTTIENLVTSLSQNLTLLSTDIKMTQKIKPNGGNDYQKVYLDLFQRNGSFSDCSLNCKLFKTFKPFNIGFLGKLSLDENPSQLSLLLHKRFSPTKEIFAKIGKEKLKFSWLHQIDPTFTSQINFRTKSPFQFNSTSSIENFSYLSHDSPKPFFDCKLTKFYGKNFYVNVILTSKFADYSKGIKTEFGLKVLPTHSLFGSVGANSLGSHFKIGLRHHLSDSLSYSLACKFTKQNINFIIDLSLSGNEFSFPITISDEVNSDLISKSLLYLILLQIILVPAQRYISHRYADVKESRNLQKLEEEKENYMKVQALMSRVATINVRKEIAKNGLVIQKAIYGDIRSLKDKEDIADKPVIDVTINLQAMVANSSISCKTNESKSRLLGFYNPSHNKPAANQLFIQYTFNNLPFEITLSDDEDIILPRPSS